MERDLTGGGGTGGGVRCGIKDGGGMGKGGGPDDATDGTYE